MRKMSLFKLRGRKKFLRLFSLWMLIVASYFIGIQLFSSDQQIMKVFENLQPSKKFAAAEFVSNEAKSVVLLAYQRGGSTLFGNMFNTNPEIFYMFEPLDALYTDMYGTGRGWNVPSEITNYWNGSQRFLSGREIRDVAQYLQNIFECDMPNLPTSFYVHPYYYLYHSEYFHLHEYIDCVSTIDKVLEQCINLKPEIETFCGSRFGEVPEERMMHCYQMLWLQQYIRGVPGRTRQAIFNYQACMRKLRDRVDKTCTPIMQDACFSQPVRAVKVVRATMDSMELLLSELPNFRVIHLIRDPRGVVVSRMKFHDSTRNRYSDSGNDTMVREAELYCRTVVRDIEVLRRLQAKHPGKLLSIVYDNFVTDIEAHTTSIYEFLDMKLPNSTVDWSKSASKGKGGKTATDIATAWQEAMTYKDSQTIRTRCSEFFKLISFEFPS